MLTQLCFGGRCVLLGQWTASDIESLPDCVENPALAFAFPAMREHEPCQARQAARQRVPLIEIKAVLVENAARDVLVDQAEVVLHECEEYVRKRHRRLGPQFLPI